MTADPNDPSLAYLQAELARLDVRIHREVRRWQLAGQPTWADDNVPLSAGLGGHTLAYLVGHNGFQLSTDEVNSLYSYLQAGGSVWAESCRRDAIRTAHEFGGNILALAAARRLQAAAAKA